MSFDGTEYRKAVLIPLRERDPAEVQDLFWLAHVPRDAEASTIEPRLREAKGFLFKEKSRARQAAVASAVLREWPRVEQTLLDDAARTALRQRLDEGSLAAGGTAPTAAPEASGGAVGGDAGAAAAAVVVAPARSRAPLSPEQRRRKQVRDGLTELARLREDPELAEDLFAFLGLPVSAPADLVRERIELIAEVNRRRRPDRERTLVDDLLVHARKLLLDGSPERYLADIARDLRPPVPAPADLRVERDGEDADLTWTPVPEATGYVVSRVGVGELGSTSNARWSDTAGPDEPTYEVVALRGDERSEPATAQLGSASVTNRSPGDHFVTLVLRAEPGPPVKLRWDEPAGAGWVLERTQGDVTRRIVPDPGAYDDRKVVTGREYVYALLDPARPDDPMATATVVPGGGTAEPAGAPSSSPAEPTTAERQGDELWLSFNWPEQAEAVHVAWRPARPPQQPGRGIRVTAPTPSVMLHGVPPGAHLAIFPARRGPDGTLRLHDPTDAARTQAP